VGSRKLGITLLRALLTVVLGIDLWLATSVSARAADVQHLKVPAGAMGRDIPVAFIADGPHTVHLLDVFNAGDAVSNGVTASHAMNTLAARASQWSAGRRRLPQLSSTAKVG
jgi:S-formylglutathione hydrolase FrmB